MAAGHLFFFERKEEVVVQNFFAEIAFVEVGFEGGFVKVLKLGKGEFGREEFEADRLVTDFAFEAREGGGENFGVVESKFWNFGKGKPAGIGGIGGGFGGVGGEFDKGVVSDADDAFARVAMERAEGVELFEEDVFEASFFFEFAPGGIVEGFIDAHEAAREGPFAFEGFKGALDEKNFEIGVVEAEDDAIDGERGARVLVSVRHSVLFTRS